MDFTATWDWPQWVMVVILFGGFMLNAANHDKPRVQSTGDEKGQPFRYNAYVAAGRAFLWVFILICGGFFQ